VISSFTLQAMAALMHQGRRVDALSRLLAAGAIAWLLLATLGCRDQAPLAFVAIGASLAAGLVQAWYATRVDFDARLFAALVSRADTEATAAQLDATLLELGLVDRAASGRDWAARWHGARRLLRRQAACLALQAIALGVGYALGESATCWNG
jgi:hypothetical protein